MADYIQEELKYLLSVAEKQESRFVQYILFTLAAFGVILGFSDKINLNNNHIIPLMLYVVLYFTTTYGAYARIMQARVNAYLNKEYFSKDTTTYFTKFYLKDTFSKNRTRDKILNFIKNPFVLFSIIPIILTVTSINKELRIQDTPFFGAVILIQISIIRRVLDMIKKNIKYFINELDKFQKNTFT